MANKKKDGISVNYILRKEVFDMLNKYCEETGLTRTAAVERFVEQGIREYRSDKHEKIREKRMIANLAKRNLI